MENTKTVWNTKQSHHHLKKIHTNATYIMKVGEEEVDISSYTGMALCGGPPKEVLYWGG